MCINSISKKQQQIIKIPKPKIYNTSLRLSFIVAALRKDSRIPLPCCCSSAFLIVVAVCSGVLTAVEVADTPSLFTTNTPLLPAIGELALLSNCLLKDAPAILGSKPTPGTAGDWKERLSACCIEVPELCADHEPAPNKHHFNWKGQRRGWNDQQIQVDKNIRPWSNNSFACFQVYVSVLFLTGDIKHIPVNGN